MLQTKQLFDHFEIDYNVLCVLTNPLAKEAKKVFRFLKEQKIDFVQFIPCLDDLDAKERNSYAPHTKTFCGILPPAFAVMAARISGGALCEYQAFDDLLNLLVKKQVTACGILGNRQVQYIIEADGSVYPIDFYCVR